MRKVFDLFLIFMNMKEAIQPETIQKIEALLLSGEEENIELGQLLAASQEYDLQAFYDRSYALAHVFRWRSNQSIGELLLNLSQLEHLVLEVGSVKEAEDEQLPLDIVFAYVDDLDDLPDDWADLLPKLQHLQIRGGTAATLPDELGLLSQLKSLRLHNVFFKQFPKSFRHLHQLESLNIIHDPHACQADSFYFSISEDIKALDSLEVLEIESPLLSLLPTQIQLVPHLKKLHINCDPEALCKSRQSYAAFKKQQLPDLLHFVPENLRAMPRLEELTLLLPAQHFPLSPKLFKNSRLRKLVVSARLLKRIPLESKEVQRLQEIKIFKPSILQYLKLSFALPNSAFEPMAHPYQKRYILVNLLLFLFFWPVGTWYLITKLILPSILPKQSSPLWRWILIPLLYPFVAIVFIIGISYFGIREYLFSKSRSKHHG